MKKIFLPLAIAAFTLSTTDVMAQDKAETVTKTEERSKENIQKEADALKTRIKMTIEKVEANKDNEKVDYKAELERIDSLTAKWEKLTGKSWEREKLIDTM
ncbi:MAG: hypothetical protein ACJAYA_000753 [Bacteroidia bacterium]|jgi:hypothetical protein